MLWWLDRRKSLVFVDGEADSVGRCWDCAGRRPVSVWADYVHCAARRELSGCPTSCRASVWSSHRCPVVLSSSWQHVRAARYQSVSVSQVQVARQSRLHCITHTSRSHRHHVRCAYDQTRSGSSETCSQVQRTQLSLVLLQSSLILSAFVCEACMYCTAAPNKKLSYAHRSRVRMTDGIRSRTKCLDHNDVVIHFVHPMKPFIHGVPKNKPLDVW